MARSSTTKTFNCRNIYEKKCGNWTYTELIQKHHLLGLLYVIWWQKTESMRDAEFAKMSVKAIWDTDAH